MTMDTNGRLMPAPNRFPLASCGSGFKQLSENIHNMGLMFGIHIMGGIPRQAVFARFPVLETTYTADMT